MPQAPPTFREISSRPDPPRQFECGWRSEVPGSASVHLGGELDLSMLPLFEATLREAQLSASTLSIDLRDLEFIDGAALHVLIDADLRARRESTSLTLLCGSGQVARALEVTGLSCSPSA